MQAQSIDITEEKKSLKSVATTALVVVLVCFAMPFLEITVGDAAGVFTLWQTATAGFTNSSIGALIPEASTGMVMVSRILAWAVMTFAVLALVMLLNPNRSSKTRDNSLWSLIFSGVSLILLFGVYFFLGYLLRTATGEDIAVSFGNGALAMITGLSVTVLVLLVKNIKNRMRLMAVLIFITIPLTIIFGSVLLDNRKYFFISLLVIFETMLPFFLIFENRKPQARELVVIAVVAAIGVVGRAIFFMVPNFKPVTAIVIIAGACLGPEAGFLTGALTAFVSNFFFGQGPWTPWQMFSFGIIGFLTGVLYKIGFLKRNKLQLCIYGVFCTICIFGLLMNAYTVFTMDFVNSWSEVLAVYASGFPVDCVHATATAFFLFVLAKPMMQKIDRVRKKYGMME